MAETDVTARAKAAIAVAAGWREALDQAVAAVSPVAPDLTLLFAAWDYAEEFPDLAREAKARLGGTVIGCSGQGIIGPRREVEDQPALSLACFQLPGASLSAVRITNGDVQRRASRESWEEALETGAEDMNGIIVFAEPYFDCEPFLIAMSGFFPGLPILGGIASGDSRTARAAVFLDGEAYLEGAVAVVLRGDYTLRTVVSQGAAPIGEPWTITGATENIIETIGMRPAYQVLVETLMGLEPGQQLRAQQNLLVGLAVDEYKDEFRRGDFLIRNLVGADRERGLLAINAYPRTGQTLQFQMRDAAAADEDLRELLQRFKSEAGEGTAVGGLLCSCNGRGAGLFGAPDHDALAVADMLGDVPVAGFFCNGEIGPIGQRTFLHGFTASLGLIVRKP
ncbi:MAG TPA: FIST N-terminal domain-containing protein [Dehalococcoidia bacterium]|nr:FIST N-terminal domain-containing protein [Dehalococcoidia bacterium]